MRTILCCALGVAMAVLGWRAQAQTPAKKAPTKKSATKSATTVHKRTATGSKSAASHKTGPVPRKTSAGTGTGAAAPAATAGKTAPARSSAARRGKKGTAASFTGPRRPATTWRNRQLAPTPDRYKEIQGALAAKGYLPPEQASGTWNQGSADALKRFQADQKLDATGKITAMSLIALGLGPRREAAAAKPLDPAPAAQTAPQEPPAPKP